MIRETERMSAVDAAWLRMDRPTNLMMIVGVVVFDSPVDFGRFRRTLEERFLAFPRFRCRAREDTLGADWVPDENFDLGRHLVRARLPTPAGQAELEAFVSELASTDLDRVRPLWQFHFIERFQGGSAAVLRIHHCYADGMAMIRVFLSLTDEEPDTVARPVAAKKRGSKDATGDGTARLEVPGAGLLRQAFAEGSAFVERAAALLQDPAQAGGLARHGLGIAGELARVATLADDPPTRFKGPLGSRKIAAWTEPLPLHEVKSLARALRCTVNDLLLSTAAGALGAYLRRHGEDTDGISIRAAVPVNLRDPAAPVSLGNHFGLVFLELPIGIRDPLERLFAVHAAMTPAQGLVPARAHAGSHGGARPHAGVGRIGGHRPVVDQGLGGRDQRARAAAPRCTSRAGASVGSSSGCRSPGPSGWEFSILSYAGQVQFGLIADAERVPDPDHGDRALRRGV